MAPISATAAHELHGASPLGSISDSLRTQASAVSWGAVAAGAAAAAALSLILLLLGVGLGLSAISPWTNVGTTAATIGLSTILWLTFTQLAASGMGGYLAGRLRTRWTGVHTDEVYFRDTAHGFLAWAVASLATAALLTSAVGSIVGGAVQAGATVAGGVTGGAAAAATSAATGTPAGGADRGSSTGYFVDSLFRADPAAPGPASTTPATSAATNAEVLRIFVNPTPAGVLPPDDLRYVGQVVAQRTGISQPEAEKRVSDAYARMQLKIREAETIAKEAADKARKASAYAALWLFISMLAGAFVASLAATYGGRNRDN